MNCNNKLPTAAKIVNSYLQLGQIMPQKNRHRALFMAAHSIAFKTQPRDNLLYK